MNQDPKPSTSSFPNILVILLWAGALIGAGLGAIGFLSDSSDARNSDEQLAAAIGALVFAIIPFCFAFAANQLVRAIVK